MYRHIFIPTLLVATFAFVPGRAFAQEAKTVPVGAMTYSFPATTSVKTTYISIPLTSSPIFSGPITAFTANSVTLAGTPFTNGQLAQAGLPYFVRFTSGQQSGRTILVTANTPNVLTLDTSDNSIQTVALNTTGFTAAANDTVEIFEGDTLASLFGDGSVENPLLFVGSTSPFTADTISIYNKSTSLQDTYFYSPTLGYWKSSVTTVNQNGKVLYPESAIAITRRSGRSATSMTVLGSVPSVALKTKTIGSSSVIYSSVRYPVDLTLAGLTFSSWKKGSSPFTADTISIYNPATSLFDSYYQLTDNSWRKSGSNTTDYSSVSIPAGSAILVLRRDALTGANSFLNLARPYSL